MKKGTLLLALSLSLCACGEVNSDFDEVKVLIEPDNTYTVSTPFREIERGDDVSFFINLKEGYRFLSCSYDDYQVEEEMDHDVFLQIFDVDYSVTISIKTEKIEEGNPDPISSSDTGDSSTPSDSEISSDPDTGEEPSTGNNSDVPLPEDEMHYYSLQGSFIQTSDKAISMEIKQYHLRENSLNGYEYLKPIKGYQLDCWNTKEDLRGENVYFGSRIPYGVKDLYAKYIKESPITDFNFEISGDTYKVSKYLGKEEEVVLPSYYNDKPITTIASNAFENSELKEIHLPNTVINIEKDAFLNSSLKEITFCNNLTNVKDHSFTGSPVETVHINAVLKPIASGTYYDAFSDKIDYLDQVKEEKKIILFSGSSTRYGYDSTRIEKAFPDYKVVNMGVFAYVNIKPQIDVIKRYLKEGDIFINSPEFDYWCLNEQFGVDNNFESSLFHFFEGNFQNLSYVNISQYEQFFDSFYSYQAERKYLPPLDYSVVAKHYDDEGNYYDTDTYNVQGDFILYRPNHPKDEWLSQPLTPYTPETFTDEMFDSLNLIYEDLGRLGVECYFTYAPKNIRALTEDSTEMQRYNLSVKISLGINAPILGDLEDSLYPGTCFYIIDNHLSTEYAAIRTDKVIGWLKQERGIM